MNTMTTYFQRPPRWIEMYSRESFLEALDPQLLLTLPSAFNLYVRWMLSQFIRYTVLSTRYSQAIPQTLYKMHPDCDQLLSGIVEADPLAYIFFIGNSKVSQS
jgi:hypothetical protein